jgi:phosphatidylglycerol:prolipoprotein diacylglycerol transferase
MSLDAYGVHLGLLYFRFYGLIIMAGAVAGAFLARWILSQRRDQDPELVWDALLWALVGGIIGARLYHILTPAASSGVTTAYYLTHPLDLIDTRQGGLGMPGAIVGGVAALALFCRRRKLRLSILLDAAAPAVALAQAIGRWGNYVNQELYGPPTTLPWGIFIRPENRLAGFEAFEHFHPLFLYESLWNLLNCVLLIWLWKRFGRRLKAGDLFLTYLITYPAGRFLLEFLRLDVVSRWGLNLNQALMGLVAVGSALALIWRQRASRAEPGGKPAA